MDATDRPSTVTDPRTPREARSQGDTRQRLLEAISAHGPITAGELAERFGLTGAAVRRHLAALEADGEIIEHERPTGARGRGRPSKAFVLSPLAHLGADGEVDHLMEIALQQLEQLGGPEAVARVATARVQEWRQELEARLRDTPRAARDRACVVQEIAALLTDRGYAATVRPVRVALPSPRPGLRGRTLETAQLVQGHCPVREVAERHPVLCEVETRALAAMTGAPVQRLATLAGGAHACTTHIPLTEGRTP
ncbi:helix-turn-helix transcriptional regulator [Brachybacterium sillae]|uniref:helix-turn-helix transcriptional regulator n=1 Tax=Brachybacterium sillae TaxID=2810536 RepID=UPI00217D74AF|nr:crosslink repair DNA glycosylase YcaQ family protein [Brachybacterium sillae]